MKLSIGENRLTKYWKKTDMSFSELFEKVSSPVVTNETFNTYLSLSKDEQDAIKDVGGFIGGELLNGSRKKENVLNRTLLALDADYLGSSANLDAVLDKLNKSNVKFITYSTRKHTKDAPRIRIIIPFKEPIIPDAYEPIARKICYELGMSFFDRTTIQVNRIMYYPSVSSDMKDQFFSIHNQSEGEPLDGMAYLENRYNNWRDRREWNLFPDEREENIRRDISIQQDPLTKEGIIGKFCQSYTIQEAIEKFLPTIYEPITEDRYTYLKGSTAGGAIIFDDKFLYSYHATDPASQHLCNAFDLVRIHKFGDTKKSFKEMMNLAASDEKVQKLCLDEDFKDFIKTAEEDDQEITEDKKITFKDILNKLTKDQKGANESTIDNMLLILNMDPNLEAFYNDIFNEWVIVTDKLPWSTSRVDEYPRGWTDTDDSGLQWYFEKYYKVTGERKIMNALNLSFHARSVHPVRDYFESLKWDGKKRIETLLIDYFGAEDNVYTREVIKKALVAAVTRIYRPGTKFDNMPILVGSQGIGKSTFLSTLGKDWFTDSLTEFSGKDAMEMLNGNLIIEIGELSGFKGEMRDIKQFLSKQSDEYRAAYARRKEVHKRQCVIFGTTNESTFLRDLTGNRRFWPVQSYPNRVKKSVWDDLPGEVDQIWAEAYALFMLGEKLTLSPEAEKLAKVEQESRLEEDPRKDMIIEYLHQKVPANWADMSIDARLMFLDQPDTLEEELVNRDRICASEIHCELFKYPKNSLDNRSSREINRLLDSIPGLRKSKQAMRFGAEYGRIRGYFIDPEFYETA